MCPLASASQSEMRGGGPPPLSLGSYPAPFPPPALGHRLDLSESPSISLSRYAGPNNSQPPTAEKILGYIIIENTGSRWYSILSTPYFHLFH
jgi:hypothetical protein